VIIVGPMVILGPDVLCSGHVALPKGGETIYDPVIAIACHILFVLGLINDVDEFDIVHLVFGEVT
jgi:hypothetical protein